MINASSKIHSFTVKNGIIRPSDLDNIGVPRYRLYLAVKEGQLKRIARGLYTLPEYQPSEHSSLAEISKKTDNCVICLLSALNFHGITTQSPFKIWIAIDRKARKPRPGMYQLEIVRFGKNSLLPGAQTHKINGVEVKITNPAKTVADCFKYRNKIGLDIAIEALKDSLRLRKASVDELVKYGKICRVANIMKPYIEAII